MNNSKFIILNGVLTNYNGFESNVIVPNNVKIIGEEAFYGNKNIISVKLPDTIKKIERCAFMHCQSLKNINLPEGLTDIGGMSFCCCLSLETITLPKTVNHIDACAFDSCYSIRNIEIPYGVKEIRSNTFQHCKNLRTVSIPSGLTFIGEGAFRGCHSLERIVFPATLNRIDNRAFAGCKKLSKVSFEGNKPSFGENVFVNTPYESGCYIATCVYGSYNCTEVYVLRRFRDKSLTKNSIGRLGISAYYKISPCIVKTFGNNLIFSNLSRKALDSLVTLLVKKGYSSEPYTDKIWK